MKIILFVRLFSQGNNNYFVLHELIKLYFVKVIENVFKEGQQSMKTIILLL